MPKIVDFKSRVVINSRGEKTPESEVYVSNGVGRYAAPSGASRGAFEAPAFPEGGLGEAMRILKQEVGPKLVGYEYSSQEELDDFLRNLDGTPNYSRIGGATAVSVSVAAAEAAAKSMNIPLYEWLSGGKKISKFPLPLGNAAGGGKHSLGRATDIQEFLAMPLNAKSFTEAIFSLVGLHSRLGELLLNRDDFFLGGRNDEGAWSCSLSGYEILSLVAEAAKYVKTQTGIKFGLGIDLAASSLWNPNLNLYVYKRSNSLRTRDEQIEYVLDLIGKFGLNYVEDPLNEQDFPGFSLITRRAPKTLICGDDLYVTSISRLMLGTRERAGNAVIIKPNQVGDLTGCREAVDLARKRGFKVVVSHRSGETPTRHLAHIALAFEADMIKSGIVGGERVAKLNELMRIEEDLKRSVPLTRIQL
ncbi:MAG: hypothetical protein ACE5GD_00395 [Candidatus Geothermarchaeales archaeon]